MDRITLSNGTVIETVSVKLPDGAVAKEFELPSGNVRVRVLPVPPMLISDVVGGREELADPPIPKVKVGGVTEKWLPARPGQEEYAEWETEMLRREKLRDEAWNDAWWGYGMAEWSLGGEWVDEPPEGWKLPARVKRLGIKPKTGNDGRRLDYIRYVLLPTNADVEACQIAMSGMTSPILSEEVATIAKLFRGQEGQEDDTEPAAE